MSELWRFKWRAFFGHLVISLLIASISAYMVYQVWHPSPLAKAVGVSAIFLMMLSIDVILGPLLTLIVAAPRKKSLKLDLTIIGMVQIVALGYGLYNIAISRPAYVAYDTGQFYLVQANELDKDALAKANAPYQSVGFGAPRWVQVAPPKNNAETQSRLQTELGQGIAPSMQPNLYQPLQAIDGEPLAKLYEYNTQATVDGVLQQYPGAVKFVGMLAREVDMAVLLDKNGVVLDVVDLRPWKI